MTRVSGPVTAGGGPLGEVGAVAVGVSVGEGVAVGPPIAGGVSVGVADAWALRGERERAWLLLEMLA